MYIFVSSHPKKNEFKLLMNINHSGVVLVLAGVGLISFIVASLGLFFRFVLETVLIAQGCFSYY